MILINTTQMHISELLTWVDDSDQLIEWAGPNVRYPVSLDTLTQDLFLLDGPSFSLVSRGQELLAFGQYYLRLGRCHLCRLIVSPTHRGKGLVRQLVELISDHGIRELGVNSCSLFVYSDNLFAIKAYQKIGFIIEDYSGADMMDGCLYMVKY